MSKVIIIDIERCLACKSCEIACAVAHSNSKVLEDAVTESPRPQKAVAVEAAGEYGVPIQCRHCEAPPCIEICPTGAIQRYSEHGPVVVNQDLCIGCKLCMLICPFGVLWIGKQGRAAMKCDMCIERIEKGQDPACIEACPTKALALVTVEEITKTRRKQASKELIKKKKG